MSADSLPDRSASVFVALDCATYLGDRPVVLACMNAEDPTERKVIALFPNEATALHRAGRLQGWSPRG